MIHVGWLHSVSGLSLLLLLFFVFIWKYSHAFMNHIELCFLDFKRKRENIQKKKRKEKLR